MNKVPPEYLIQIAPSGETIPVELVVLVIRIKD
jgi:hypothetical protein